MSAESFDDVAVILAVKDLANAKSRLQVPGVVARDELVAAMVTDTLRAVREAGLPHVIVVTPDVRVIDFVNTFGVLTHSDPGGGLNSALSAGAAGATRCWAPASIAYLQADLPALTSPTLQAALTAATAHRAAFVADRGGDGTALLVSAVGEGAVAPAFGIDSAAAHRRAGAIELDPAHRDYADLRCDVDTPDDLAAATALGVGMHTARQLQVNSPAHTAHDRNR